MNEMKFDPGTVFPQYLLEGVTSRGRSIWPGFVLAVLESTRAWHACQP